MEYRTSLHQSDDSISLNYVIQISVICVFPPGVLIVVVTIAHQYQWCSNLTHARTKELSTQVMTKDRSYPYMNMYNKYWKEILFQMGGSYNYITFAYMYLKDLFLW